MKLYKSTKHNTQLETDDYTPNDISLEERIRIIESSGEPIEDGAPLTYTDRADGVLPEYNIRTDRQEIALDAMDKVHASLIAKREEIMKQKAEAQQPKKEE